MPALTFITDQTTKRRYARIDLAEVADKDGEQLEEMMDVIIAEARKNDEEICLDELESELKSEGRF